MLDTNASAERAAVSRTAVAWRSWRELAGLLVNRNIPLRYRGSVYEACIRSAMLHGCETWPMTESVKRILLRTDRRMLRYMAGVSWRDAVRSAEVAARCGVRELDDVLRARRLRWFGHVERRGDGEALGRIRNLEVPGRRPPGRPKTTWKKNMDDELTSHGLNRMDAMDRDEWRAIVNRLTS